MDMYNMIEDVAAIGSVPLTPYGTPITSEVPDAIEPYLEEHDVMPVSYTHLDVYKRQPLSLSFPMSGRTWATT